jgi:hypothetical protein
VLGPALDNMLAAARAHATFAVRLRRVLDERERTVNAWRKTAPPTGYSKEENAFVCAGDDLLEAMFMSEVRAIRARPAAAARARGLDELRHLLQSTELNPSWNDYARQRIQAVIDGARGASAHE